MRKAHHRLTAGARMKSLHHISTENPQDYDLSQIVMYFYEFSG